jgi:hypothetical protein
MSRPPPHVHGKEGVDGSSPSEGSTKRQQMALFIGLGPLRCRHDVSPGCVPKVGAHSHRGLETGRSASTEHLPGREGLDEASNVDLADASRAPAWASCGGRRRRVKAARMLLTLLERRAAPVLIARTTTSVPLRQRSVRSAGRTGEISLPRRRPMSLRTEPGLMRCRDGKSARLCRRE